MWLKSFRVVNFKSFEDIDRRALDRRVNVVVGQNNTGQTALLQALSFQITHVPHKSSKLRREDLPNPHSRFEVEFVLTGQELRDALLALDSTIYLPVPQNWTTLPDQM